MAEPARPDDEARPKDAPGRGMLPALRPEAGGLVCSDLPMVKRALGDIRTITEHAEAEKLYREARELAAVSRDEDALAKCLAALGHAGDFGPARALAGSSLASLKRNAEAAEYVEKAERESPNDVRVLYHAGSTYRELGQRSKAESRYRLCLKIDPAYFKAECALAMCAIDADEWVNASGHVERLIEMNPDCPCAYTRLALCQLELHGRSAALGARESERLVETLETGLELCAFQHLLHGLREPMRTGDGPRVSDAIEKAGLAVGQSLETSRVRSDVRDGKFPKAYSETLALDVPDSLRVLKEDQLASLSARMARDAGDAGDEEERRSHEKRAEWHLESAEKLVPGYWLTARIRRGLARPAAPA